MPSRNRRNTLIAFLMALIGSTTLSQAQSAADSAGATVTAFHAALASGDSAAALALLAPDVAILESGGRETLTEYRSHHLPGDIRFARSVPAKRQPLQVTVVGEVAWAAGTSESAGTIEGRSIASFGAELVVLSRTPSGWRIRAIHWSSRRRPGAS